MAEKNSLWKNIRNKAKQNRASGATPKKPTAEMLRQERKIKANKADGGPIGGDSLYNMQRALELGYTPDATGHWPSVDSETGMFLKSKEHPTAWMEYLYGHALNPELNRTTNVVVNPEGYFGDNQLQYIPKAQYSDGGPTGDNEKNVVLKPRSVYDSKTGETRNYQVSDDNKTIIDASDPTQTINYFLPEVEISEEAPAWLKSQRKNPELYSGSGRAEPSYPEMALLPGSLPFKATSRLGKLGLGAAEMVNPLSGFKDSLKSSLGQTKDQLSKAVKGTSSLYKEIKGELFQGKANRKSIEEGNQWLQNWINHPTTQAKIDKDIDNYVSILKRNELQNLENNFGSLKISDPAAYSSLEDDILNSPDYIADLIRDQSKNFKPNSKEYSLFKQADENLQQYLNPKENYNLDPIHQRNWGVSYQHGISPSDRQYVQSGAVDPFERYGSWISRSTRMPQYQRVGTTIHEGTHDWVSDEAFKKVGIRNSVLKNMNPEIKKDFLEWESLRNQGIDPETVMGAERAYQAYLADPTEMHARIMELRKQLQLTPDYKMDLNSAKNIINFIEDEKSFITPKILNVVDKDPKKFAELFNNFWVAAPIAGGALYQLEQNSKPKQQATGGYTMKNNNQSWRNYLQYATGGTYDEEVYSDSPFNDDKRRNTILNSPSNEGNTYFKPATDWAANWVSDPEYATRLNENFPDRSKITKVDTLFKSKQNVRQDKRNKNLEGFATYIPTLVNDIKDTRFLYNSNPNTNDQLYRDYSSSYTPENLAEVNKQLTENPQAFTDPYGNAVVRNRANDPGQAGAMSAGEHEIWHQGKIPDSKMDMFGNRDYETLDKAYAGKFATPHPSTWSPNSKGVVKSPDKKEFYPMLMQIRMDNGFQPGEIIDDARLNQIRKSGSTNPLFKYYDNEQLKKYLNTFASNTTQPNTQGPYTQITAQGGYVNNARQYSTGGVDQDAVMGAVSKGAGAIPGYGQAIQTGMALNNATADIGNSIMMSQTPDRYKGFMAEEQKRGKWMNYINPAVGMAYRTIGAKDRLNDFKEEESKQAASLGTAQFNAANPIEQVSLNSPISANGGYITNNSLNLQNNMRYKKFAKGGTFDQYGINMIPDSAGLHHQSAYGGVPIGPDALAEGGEIKMDTGDGGQYIVSDQVDGAQTQKDFTFSKGGKYKELNRTLADGMKQDLNKFTFGSLATSDKVKGDLRRPNDSYAQSTIEQIKQKWQQKTEFARQRSQQEQAIAQAEQQKKLIEEEYIAAYGGKINPKKYPGLNMSKKSKGGYVYNPMTQPMLATGGPIYGDPASPYTYGDGGSTKYPKPQITNNQVMNYLADMNERGMLEPGRQFTPKWESVNDVNGTERMIDLTKELNSTDLERVKSLYNFKQKNRNAFGFAKGGMYAMGGMYGDPYYRGGQIDYTNDMYSSYAGGGPMVGNAPQAFKGYAAQNRGGMLMNYADGGMMSQDQQMMQEQQMMQQAPQEQMQQQGGQEQMMQMVQQVMQAIMQGANPEEIMQQLVQSGMPPEQAQQIIQMAMQEAQGQQQQQPMQGQEQMMLQQGMMSSGGKLPKEILRARVQSHMSPKEASNYVNNYSSGGKMRYDGGGGFNFSGTPVIDIPSSDQYSVGELTDDSRFWADETEYPTIGTAKTPNGMGMNFKNAQQMGNQITNILQNQNSNNSNNLNQNTDAPWSEEPWYSKAARYSQAIPGIAATITGLKNKKRRLDPSLMVAQRVSYEPERIVDREESRNALNAGLRQMRTMGATPGAIMGNTRDAVLSSNKGLAGRIAESVMREANTNAQFGQQADLTNTAARNQFKQINEGMFQNAQTQALAGLQDTTSKLANTAQEERKQYLQEWIAKNRLNTRNYSTADSGQDVFYGNNGEIYDARTYKRIR